jgi:carbamoyltransferase
MITLGIHDGHTATACLMKDGKILACVSEERLVRVKEWGGFPEKSIRECLRIAGISASQIQGVGVVGLLKPTLPGSYNEPHLSKKVFAAATKLLPDAFFQSNVWVKSAQRLLGRFRGAAEIKAALVGLGIQPEPSFYEHHFLHAVSAHFCSWMGTSENLVITCDGSGDAVCASVNVARGTKIERIAEMSNYNSIGEFYTQITQFLGMKPMSHEYKVMGLAPYAKVDHSNKTLQAMERFFTVNGTPPITFKNTSGNWKWQYLEEFRKTLAGHRFDNIARAAQSLLEKILVQWVLNCVKHTGIRRVALNGGVFMNVKANNLILEMPEINELFIFPTGGDESQAIAAAIWKSIELGEQQIEPLGPLYYGPEFDEDEIKEAIDSIPDGFRVARSDDIDSLVGHELAKGKIVSRFAGRMEWGARALGNRSILADARNRDAMIKINEAIKNRDFWMPFAPTVLDTRADEYLINPKGFYAPYMAVAFPTKLAAKRDLIAALHPYDLTARPQVLKESWNPGYYRVLKSFEKETGVGGVLNTSFNLHGEAIVCNPQDALKTFQNSALDALALGPYLISR